MMPRGGTPAAASMRLDFAEGIRGRARIGRVDRHVGGDRAGAFVQPGLRQPHHVGALRGGKAAAALADEDHDRLVGFLRSRSDGAADNRPGMLAVVTASSVCVQAPSATREADQRPGRCGRRGCDRRVFWLSSFSVLVPPQSVIKP